MIYQIIVNNKTFLLDEEEKQFFQKNQDKRFIELKNGELINPAFCSGVYVDSYRTHLQNVKMLAGTTKLSKEDETTVRELIEPVGSVFNKTENVVALNKLLEKYTIKTLTKK